MKKSLWMLFSLLLVASMVLAACGGVTQEEPTATPKPAATEAPETTGKATEEPVVEGPTAELTVWDGWAGDYEANILSIFDAYMGMNPGVKIETVEVEDFQNKLATAVPAGEGPDIVCWVHDKIGEWAEIEVLAPINEYIDMAAFKATYIAPAVDAVSYKDGIYGFPESIETVTLIYNKALISAEEIPATADELLALAEAWDKSEYLLAFNVKDAYFGAFAMQAGPAFYVNAQGGIGLDPDALPGAEFIAALREFSPEEVDYGIADTLFKEGKSAMIINGPWYIADVEGAGIDYGMATLPVIGENPGQPFLGVKFCGITPLAVERGVAEAAVAALGYYTNAENQVFLAESNKMVPTTKAALADSAVKALTTVSAFGNQATLGAPMPNTPYMGSLWDPVAQALTAIWNGTQPPDVAVIAAQAAACEGVTNMGGDCEARDVPEEGGIDLASAAAVVNTDLSGAVIGWDGWAGDYEANILTVFDAYMELNPNVTFESVEVEDFQNKLATAVPAGEGPDIVCWVHDKIGEWAEIEVLAPIDEYIDVDLFKATYIAPAVDAVSYKGSIYGFPESVETVTVIYNKALISAEEIPATADELLALAEAWDKSEYLLAFNVKDAYFGAFAIQAGEAYYVDADGNVGVGMGLEGAEFIAALREFSPEEVDYGIADTLFKEGKSAMIINGPWYIADVEGAGIDYGMATLPMIGENPGQPFLGVKFCGITPLAVERGVAEAAVNLLAYYTHAANQVFLAESNKMVPTTPDALLDPAVQALTTVAAFGEQATYGAPMPNTPFMGALWDPVAQALTAIWNGTQTAEEALQAAQTAAEEGVAGMQ